MKLPADSGPGSNDLLGMGQPRAATPGATNPAVQAPADPMFVNWQGRMDFDGQTAHFERQIVGQSSMRNMKTDNLDVVLRQRVVFAQMRPQDQTQVGRILCHGQTLMESRAMEQDKLASIDRMQVRDLMVDEVTGLVEGQGPGWITSVRHGDDNLMGPAGQPGGPPNRSRQQGQPNRPRDQARQRRPQRRARKLRQPGRDTDDRTPPPALAMARTMPTRHTTTASPSKTT